MRNKIKVPRCDCEAYPFCRHATNAELLPAAETPFNLAGEPIDNSTTAEGEARVRALAEAEARKAQLSMFECAGTFDGFTCGSDADPGL